MKPKDLPEKELRPVVNESGIAIRPLYTAEDVAASGGAEMIGLPGQYPFTRGIHSLMYRKQPFTMRQYTGFGNPADTNKRFHYLIANGQTGLNAREASRACWPTSVPRCCRPARRFARCAAGSRCAATRSPRCG